MRYFVRRTVVSKKRRRRVPRALLLSMTMAAAVPTQASETVSYTYDALGRLVKVSHAGTVNNGTNACYAYDPASNRSNVNVAVAASCANPSGTVTFSISNSGPVVEGAPSTFTVSKVGTAAGTLTVNYATANGTAVAPGDYTAASGTLTFLVGDTAKTISVTTIDDTVVESPETFTMSLSAPSAGATINVGSATATINDNDTNACSGVSFSVNDTSVTEGGTLTFTVTKAGSSTANCSVSYSTADASAVTPTNYTSAAGTLTFTPSQTSQTVSVSTVSDGVSPETLAMHLNLTSAASGGTISDAQGIGTINDDGINNCQTQDCNGGPLGMATSPNLTRSARASDVR